MVESERLQADKRKRRKRAAQEAGPAADSPAEEYQEGETINEKAHLRKKRFAITSFSSLWPFAKVPYIFDDEYRK